MELFNQIIFAIFSLILVGIYFSTVRKESSTEFEFFNPYWPASLLLRATSFAAWALVPLFNKPALVLANISFVASTITIALFIRSWTYRITLSQKKALLLLLISVTCLYIYLLVQENGYSARAALIGSVGTAMAIWEGYELWRNLKRIQSLILRLTLLLVSTQTVIGIALAIFLSVANTNQVPNILLADVNASAFLFVTFGLQLLTYVFINSFLYERLWIKEKLTLIDLKNKQDELTTTPFEKNQIAFLLKEKEVLISSLLKSNKTAATGALSASIAHELNQPLGASLINIQFLKMMADSGHLDLAAQKNLIEALESDTQRAGNIVKTLRSIFLEQNIKLTAINASEVLLSLLPIIESELKSKNIQLSLNIAQHIQLKLSKTEFQQLILNILNNAIEALNTVEQDHKSIAIEATQNNECTEISIADNGPGIAPHLRDGIFELLTGDKKACMGLGLWLCSHIMQRHGGKIYVDYSTQGVTKLVMRFQ